MSSGGELPALQEIMDGASKSVLLNEPHVKRLWELCGDRTLFSKSPDYLAKLRKDLLRSSLKYFDEHSEFYHELFKRMEIDVKAAGIEDLIKLAVPSDLLRGDGYRKFLIENLKEPGIIFSSSGTTNNTPVRIFRSYLELAMMTKANTLLFEYVYGGELKEGCGAALFLAARELRSVLNFVAFVDLALQYKKIKLIYGMDMVGSTESNSQWGKLIPNQRRIMDFLKSDEEPKLLFTAPAGIHLLTKKFEEMNLLKKVFAKVIYGIPPVDLGEGGVIVTGGGSKGFVIPPYKEIVESAGRYFKGRVMGEVKPAPFMDVYGMTETLTALIDRFGSMDKVPHPLQEVFLIDLKTLKLIDEPGKEGVAVFFDPLIYLPV